MTSNEEIVGPSLRYAVEWRPYLWLRPLQYALGHPARFAGKRVLELGCRYGKMACWFAAQGAIVRGLDLAPGVIEVARTERSKWKIPEDRLSLDTYDGNLGALPREQYDFVFTKSVLVLMNAHSEALAGISALLKPGGEYLAVENAAAGFPISLIRRYLHRNWRYEESFHGVNAESLSHFRRVFREVNCKKFWGLVYAIQAHKE
jgi:SAM-dependent methyltransferase